MADRAHDPKVPLPSRGAGPIERLLRTIPAIRNLHHNVVQALAVLLPLTVIIAATAVGIGVWLVPKAPTFHHSGADPSLAGMVGAGPDNPVKVMQAPDKDGFFFVPVFYGTNRAPSDGPVFDWRATGFWGGIGILFSIGGIFLAVLARVPHTLSERWAARFEWLIGFLPNWMRATFRWGGRGAICACFVVSLAAVFHGVYCGIIPIRRGELPFKDYSTGADSMHYGVCWVNIPKDHRMGVMETPGTYQFNVQPNPEKHVMIAKSDEFDSRSLIHFVLATARSGVDDLKESPIEDRSARWFSEGDLSQQVMVFIHGYNCSFEDAIRRTGQIAYDLKFPGAAVCFSWPSNGFTPKYTYDRTRAEASATELAGFLKLLRNSMPDTDIHLVAHSMGNYCLVNALKSLKLDNQLRGTFAQVVFTAPDVDETLFKNSYPQVKDLARRATMYASLTDVALRMSVKVNGYNRIGLGGEHLNVIPPIDTIDATNIKTDFMGHSYMGDSSSVICDLRDTLRGVHPKNRFFLRAGDPKSIPHPLTGPFWVFEKTRTGN